MKKSVYLDTTIPNITALNTKMELNIPDIITPLELFSERI